MRFIGVGRRSKIGALVSAAATLSLLVACSPGDGGDGGDAPPSTAPSSVAGFGALSGVRVVAAGDIACAPGEEVTSTTCRQADTARLVGEFRPRFVLPLGDLQYDDGDLKDFELSYAKTWGRFEPITRPVPGNHDYHVGGAEGYLAFFQKQTGGRSYYAFDIGDWRYYALDSNCSDVDCDEEAAWLDRDMAENPRTCTAIAMHHPRYSSSSEHGDQEEVSPLWEVALRHDADLALGAHDHDYERFEAMDADGNVTDGGIVSFVVGTGGKSLYDLGDRDEGSVLFYNERAGVLDLKLGRDGYGWRFRNVDGKTIDAGVHRCH
jgi:acid phosphatase type 7